MDWNEASANGIAHISWAYNTNIQQLSDTTMPQDRTEVDVCTV